MALIAIGALACALALAPPAFAQTVVGDVGLGVPESGSHSLANALAEASVELSSGVLRSSLRLILPAARGGPQPALGLGYSSANGIREAGVGWGLNLPVIERHNQSGPPAYVDPPAQGAFDPEQLDRLTYKGEPLVPICRVDNSVCPQVASEPMPGWAYASGWMYYRLQRDSAFARFFWSPDRRTWRIQAERRLRRRRQSGQPGRGAARAVRRPARALHPSLRL